MKYSPISLCLYKIILSIIFVNQSIEQRCINDPPINSETGIQFVLVRANFILCLSPFHLCTGFLFVWKIIESIKKFQKFLNNKLKLNFKKSQKSKYFNVDFSNSIFVLNLIFVKNNFPYLTQIEVQTRFFVSLILDILHKAYMIFKIAQYIQPDYFRSR